MQEVGFVKSASKEKILQRASQCSIGVFLDDPPNISALKELFTIFLTAPVERLLPGEKKKSDAD